MDEAYEFDVFVSHASEDKGRFVEPLVVALKERGLRVWYDAEQIGLGDDFRQKIDQGLLRSRFGVVVLSPRFFKEWPQAELSALFAGDRLLPIRCDLGHEELARRSPLLATKVNLSWELGVAPIADRIRDRVRGAVAEAHSVQSPVYNMPARRARQLFGRDDDLVRLDALLVPGQSVSIEGLAGVGKTELALHIVGRLAAEGRFPGGIFWFNAEESDLTTVWGSAIADALAVGPGTVQERAAAAVRIASSGGPILVVLDNVESWTRGTEPKPLPDGPRALLATTRQKYLAGQAFEHYALDVLRPDAARELLVSMAGRDLARLPGLDELLHQLEGHSLAIELAGAYLREFPTVTPAEYLRRLQKGLPVEEKVQDRVRYEATVGSALDVYWAKLDEAAREALLIAACFAPEEASIALMEACGASDDALHPLRRFHLIVGDGERWRMHRLVRDWARRVASAEALAQAKHKFVGGCVEYSRRITLQEGVRIYRSDGKHLEQAVDEAAAILGPDDLQVTFLQNGLGIALQSMGDLSRAKELLEITLASVLKNFGEDHPDVASARSNLAILLRDLGDVSRAKQLHELALASDLKNLGEDHPSVAIKRSNLAIVLKDVGDLPRAKELLELALASALKNLGEDHPSVAIYRSVLAITLKDLGDVSRAKELFELALASDLKSYGEDHPSVAVRRSNLATLLGESGDFAAARVLLSQALATKERSLGAGHPSTALTRASLAYVLDFMGETDSAHAEAKRAVEVVANQPAGSFFRAQVEELAAKILNRP